jgi:hypothetical protein
VTARALIVEDQAGELLPEPTRFRGLAGFLEAPCEGEEVLPFRPRDAEAGMDEVVRTWFVVVLRVLAMAFTRFAMCHGSETLRRTCRAHGRTGRQTPARIRTKAWGR